MRRLFTIVLSAVCVLGFGSPAFSATRVKDIGHIAGIRSNSLEGYGLVIGLNKTGDKGRLTQQTWTNLLEHFGLSADSTQVRVENIALVVVTADIPAFARNGSKIDATVASVGDATSLQGGILLETPLIGTDGAVYALAQGPLTLGGFVASGGAGGNSATVNHPTVARIPNGGVVEQSISVGLPQFIDTMDFVLDRQDFTNVTRVVDAVNLAFGRSIASPVDGRSVRLALPADYRERPVEFIAALEAVRVDVDTRAQVSVNERTGTVVIGSDVKISAVTIAHGSLSIQVQTQQTVSQPGPLSNGQTAITPETRIRAQEEQANFVKIPQNATVDDLIRVLNSLGVTPRDTIAILEALKVAGALQAELVLM